MSATRLPSRIRRILVALDASAPSLAALEAAAAMAAGAETELVGLFVEDENLLRLAGLPFASELDLVSGIARTLAPTAMEQQLRAQARRARERLEQAATRFSVNWKFQVARGQVAAQLMMAGLQADVIALGAMGARSLYRARMGSTARTMISDCTRTLLIFPPRTSSQPNLGVLLDNSPESFRALELMAELAWIARKGIVAFVLADDIETEQQLRQAAETRSSSLHVNVRYHRLPNAEPAALARAVREERIGTLAVASGRDRQSEERVQRLLKYTDSAVLLVREEPVPAAG